jgi:hypothetical protein
LHQRNFKVSNKETYLYNKTKVRERKSLRNYLKLMSLMIRESQRMIGRLENYLSQHTMIQIFGNCLNNIPLSSSWTKIKKINEK